MPNSMSLKSLAVSTLLLLSFQAKSYQFEAFSEVKWFDQGQFSAQDTTLGGTYYLDTIDQSDVPLAEAAFLNRSTGVYFSFTSRAEETLITTTGVDENSPATSNTLTNDRSDVLIGMQYSQQKLNFNGGVRYFSEEEYASNVLFFLAGLYLEEDFLVQLGFSRFSSDNPGLLDDTRFLAEARKVMRFQGKYLALEGRFIFDGDSQSDSDFEISADYYFNKKLSAGLFMEGVSDGIASNDTALGIRTSWFFKPLIAVEASYHGLGNDYDSLFIRLTGRFN